MIVEKVLISLLFLATNITAYLLLPAKTKYSYKLLVPVSGIILFLIILIKNDILVFQTMPKRTFNGLIFFSIALPIFWAFSKLQNFVIEKKINKTLKPGYLKAKPVVNFVFLKLIFAMVFIYQLYIVWDESAPFRKYIELP